MTELQLKAQSAFSKQPHGFDGIAIAAVEDIAIVSLATPLGGADALASSIQSAFGVATPTVGSSIMTRTNPTRFVRLAQDQMFALFQHPASGRPLDVMASTLGQAAYLTDQSDSWAALRIHGPKCRAALERICALDLHEDQFPPHSIARTMMEHLSVILICEGTETYLLLSARSSADSFLHAIETSARNVT